MPGKFPLKILVGLAACTWLAVAVVLYDAKFEVAFFKPFTIVTAVVAAALASFDRLLWRLPVIKWLHDTPNLRGTWIGQTRSMYKEPTTGKIVPPIKTVVVITQTYTSIHVRLFTAESTSVSLAGGLVPEPDGLMKLWYAFRNEPRLSVQKRSRVNHGGAQLALGDKDEVLEGSYWTDRETSGEITLRYTSWRRAKDFSAGLAIEGRSSDSDN